MQRKLEMMDQAIMMLVQEAKAALKGGKARAFEKELARVTKAD